MPAFLDGCRGRLIGRAQFQGEGDAVFADGCPEEHVDGVGHVQSQLGENPRRLFFDILVRSDVQVRGGHFPCPRFDDKCRN